MHGERLWLELWLDGVEEEEIGELGMWGSWMNSSWALNPSSNQNLCSPLPLVVVGQHFSSAGHVECMYVSQRNSSDVTMTTTTRKRRAMSP